MEKKGDILVPDTVVMEEEQLKGLISLRFKEDMSFNRFCEEHFENFNPERFEAIALRLFSGKETQTTLYALDKFRQEYNSSKLPVKKFKSEKISLKEILPFLDEYNFTVTAANYSLEQMEVINK